MINQEEKHQIMKDYLELIKDIEDRKVIVICKKCGRTDIATSFDQYFWTYCNQCYEHRLDGVVIPTFD
jgi:hypothetical protein